MQTPDPVAGLWVVADTAADGVLTVLITGELCITTADTARTQLRTLLERSPAPQVRLDLSGLDFCDLTGLRILLQVSEQSAAAGRTVRVSAASPAVSYLLTLTETAPLLGYQPTADSPPDGTRS
ncbi:STAS domain-containing protein [Actinoplanes sp. NPDC051346]|uniref:STAS domain-containing protein n=1 Tax=Actinoplanes sp. NPDC051346 TaxID=3155048 RepID=UPI00343E7C34